MSPFFSSPHHRRPRYFIKKALKYTLVTSLVLAPPFFYYMPYYEKRYSAEMQSETVPRPLRATFYYLTAWRRVMDTSQLVFLCGGDIMLWHWLWTQAHNYNAKRLAIHKDSDDSVEEDVSSDASHAHTHSTLYQKIISYDPDWGRYMDPVHHRVATRMLHFCERNGGLVVKIGQAMASMPMLPEAYGTVLKVLFDRNPPMEYEVIKRVIENDLGGPIEKFFVEFEKKPIGSASLAQVHRAVLRGRDSLDGLEHATKISAQKSNANKEDSETVSVAARHNTPTEPTPVAVKIEYPYISYFQSIDFFNMRMSMDITYYFLNMTGSPMKDGFNTSSPSFKDVCERFTEEIDLNKEAQNARRVKENFKKWPLVHIPTVYTEFCSPRVLTMEFIDDACVATDVEQMKKWNLSPKECTQVIMDAFAKQLFEDGFLHADPHRSNVFVRKHPTLSGRPQVVILDHGLYVQLDNVFRRRYARYYEALALNDTDYLKEFLRLYHIDEKYYKIFASVVLMDAYDDQFMAQEYDETGSKIRSKMKRMMKHDFTEEQLKKVETAQRDLGKAFSEELPPALRFVMRNSFLLRSVNSMNGSPCNRLITNARWAARCVNHVAEDEGSTLLQRWSNGVRQAFRSVYFEYRLQLIRFQTFMMYMMMKYLPQSLVLFFAQRKMKDVMKNASATEKVASQVKLETV